MQCFKWYLFAVQIYKINFAIRYPCLQYTHYWHIDYSTFSNFDQFLRYFKERIFGYSKWPSYINIVFASCLLQNHNFRSCPLLHLPSQNEKSKSPPGGRINSTWTKSRSEIQLERNNDKPSIFLWIFSQFSITFFPVISFTCQF